MGKVGAPYGNKNAAGRRGGSSYKSGNYTIKTGSKGDKKLKANFLKAVKKSWK